MEQLQGDYSKYMFRDISELVQGDDELLFNCNALPKVLSRILHMFCKNYEQERTPSRKEGSRGIFPRLEPRKGPGKNVVNARQF